MFKELTTRLKLIKMIEAIWFLAKLIVYEASIISQQYFDQTSCELYVTEFERKNYMLSLLYTNCFCILIFEICCSCSMWTELEGPRQPPSL